MTVTQHLPSDGQNTAKSDESGLSAQELARIRDILTSGRKPKVTFTKSAGQIAGQLGQVVALTDPNESDEWVVVRFGRDELPFSPADLAVPQKPAPNRKPPTTPTNPDQNKPENPQTTPTPDPTPTAEVPAPRQETPIPLEPPTLTPDRGTNHNPDPLIPTSVTAAPPSAAQPKTPTAPTTAARANANPRKIPRPKAPPTLTVTLTYADGDWMVCANQGPKTLAKPYVVRPCDALRMVGMLDVSGVREAVEEIVQTARTEARNRADQLRAELAEVEARLAELQEDPAPTPPQG